MPKPSRAWQGYVRLLVIFVVAFFVVSLVPDGGAPGSPLRPVGFLPGVGFALTLVFGVRSIAISLVAAIARNLCFHTVDMAVPTALLYAVNYGIVAYVLLRFFGRRMWLADMPSTLQFLLGGFAAPLFSALFGIVLLHQLPVFDTGEGARGFPALLVLNWTREAAGVCSLGPFIMVHLGPRLRKWVGPPVTPSNGPPPLSIAEAVEALIESVATAMALFAVVYIRQLYGINMIYLAFLPQLAVAARLGMGPTTISIAGSTLLSSWLWHVLGWGSFLPLVDFRLLIISSSLTALLLAAIVEERRWARLDLQMLVAQFRALAHRSEAIREEERSYIAREVHDELGQSLTGLKMDLSFLARRFASGEPVETLLPEFPRLGKCVDEVVEAVRRLATELRPGILDTLGVGPAIEWHTRDFQKRTGIACRVARLDLSALDPDRSTALFRIFQEALTNVVRHAAASHVVVHLERALDRMVLTVEDDGTGVTPDQVNDPGSLGILGMRERAARCGGVLTIAPRPQGGTLVRAEFPLTTPPAGGV